MTSYRGIWILLGASLGAAGTLRAQAVGVQHAAELKVDGLAALQALPLSFQENLGQLDPSARFAARRPGIEVVLEDRGFAVQLKSRVSAPYPAADWIEHVLDTGGGRLVQSSCDSDPIRIESLRFEFLGSSPATLEGRRPLRGRVNVCKGSDPKHWVVGARTYAAVRYHGLYQGIDVEIYDVDGKLEYDLLAEPGADLNQVAIRCDGGQSLEIDREGSLVVRTDMGEVIHKQPVSYRVAKNGERTAIASRFRLLDDRTFSFEVDDGRGESVVIDPGLQYSTLLGGAGSDMGTGIALDDAGMVYVCGQTDSGKFPETTDLSTGTKVARRTISSGLIEPDTDVFVVELDLSKAADEQLVYATIFGGTNDDSPANLRVDSSGAVYVSGQTFSSDFPVTPGAYQTALNGLYDEFVTKLDPLGAPLIYSTYLGGSGGDYSFGIAIDSTGAAYVTGGTDSLDYPITPGAFDSVPGADVNAFVTKLDPTGTSLVYSTFIDGFGFDDGWDIEIEAGGDAYVTGRSGSPDFPTTPGAYQTAWAGSLDSFVLRLSADGASVPYCTFVSALRRDEGHALEIDDTGVYVTGVARSEDWPTTPGSYDPTGNGGYDAYAFKLDPTLSTLLFSTFLGGANHDVGWDIGVDVVGQVYATGVTYSPDYPSTVGSYMPDFQGLTDAYISKLDATGSQLLYSTFLGKRGTEEGIGLAMGGPLKNQVYLTGNTFSKFFPTTSNAFDQSWNGGVDAYVAWIDPITKCEAAFFEYGTGYPGTSGIPSLTLDQAPVICSNFSLLVGNSYGALTQAVIFVGLLPADVPTDLGGDLLVTPNILVSLALSPGTNTLPLLYTCDSNLCGLIAYLQVLEVDPGATKGVAFTPGLQINIGTL